MAATVTTQDLLGGHVGRTKRSLIGLLGGIILLVGCAPASAPTSSAPTAPAVAPSVSASAAPSSVAHPRGTGSPAVASASAAPAAGSPSPVTAPSAAPAAVSPVPSAAAGPLTPLSVVASQLDSAGVPLWAAQALGIFAQNGLSVNQSLSNGGGAAVAQILSGQVNLMSGSGSEALSAIANGADLVIVGNLAPVYPYVLEVGPDIQSPQDLVGKTLGVSSLGGSGEQGLDHALTSLGVDPSQVTVIATGSTSNRLAALLSGAVQGAIVSTATDAPVLEAQGFRPMLDLAAQHIPASTSCVVGQRSWIYAHPQVVQAFIDSVIEATAAIKQDKPLGVQLLEQNYNSTDEAQMSADFDYLVREELPAVPAVTPDQFADALSALAASDPAAAQRVDLSHVIDPSFVQNAVDRGLAS